MKWPVTLLAMDDSGKIHHHDYEEDFNPEGPFIFVKIPAAAKPKLVAKIVRHIADHIEKAEH